MGFGSGGKRGGLFVAHMDPLDLFLAAQRVGKAVEGIAHHAKHTFYAGLLQGLGDEIGNGSGHGAGSSKQ